MSSQHSKSPINGTNTNIENILSHSANAISNNTSSDTSLKNKNTENEVISKQGLSSSLSNSISISKSSSPEPNIQQLQQEKSVAKTQKSPEKTKTYWKPWSLWSNNEIKFELNLEDGRPRENEIISNISALKQSNEDFNNSINNDINNDISNDPTITTAINENILTATENNNHHENITNTDNENSNLIWNITRRVSIIPFLPMGPNGQISVNEMTPNKCSPVTDNNEFTATSNPLDSQINRIKSNNTYTNSDNTKKSNNTNFSDENDSARTGTWWTPWNWNYKKDGETEESVSDLDTGIIEDELMKVQRREIANQIKCQSYGIPKSVVWGNLQQLDEDFCHVRITGNTYKKPVIMRKMPESAFELNERQLIRIHDNNKIGDTIPSVIESIVLPDIEWNYRNLTMKTKCRIALSKIPALQTFFLPQLHLYYQENKNKNKNINTKKKKITKNVVVLCFHGFLPQKIVKNLIGENTSSAEQMKEFAMKELNRWSDIQNINLNINTICLEGYGKLFERVNECLSILENWTETINNCDYILAISNSHNIPLTIHVIARLITSGILDNTEKLGFIGFSGLSMGPIPEIESKISTRGSVGQDNDIISELFDFQDPDSFQSKELIRSIRIMIKRNFKITFIGSLNDCFTSLYSSLALHLIHPNIYRAIYIDSSQNQPDFLTSLLNLILTIKNLNYNDHGLLLELSNFFIGNIGEGQHSKVITNKYGYRIGINNMLNTSDLFYQRKLQEEVTNIKEYVTNSYHIPWCLRGFLEELGNLQKHFDVKQIIYQLYEEFKSWEPETQKMKDLRYCMLAIENVQHEDLGF